ncbi:alpha/beta hydrolase [Streptomyces sp. LX-29]|uniref:alpha/beta hydrolase family protein n=1 Tax=Streptomyces sp. LX-29 TaxID=2900152 RepID=UPI00240E2DA9|nr:alpha/beta hydrolase [Streptomyces sp. LX-29]WFB05989.1 alpha/beta hydrolase [Streptomyces sp. LX-29]
MPRTSMTPAVALLSLALALPAAAPAYAAPPSAGAPASVGADTRGDRDVRLQLPRPTGPYAVGRDTLHLVDRDRRDPWVPTAGSRELMVGMFYPALPRGGRPARYATVEEARLLLEAYGLDGVFPPETLSATATHGRFGARPVRGRHPLVVLSPGWGASAYTLTGLAEDLASRGYVVAAVDHAYESVGSAFPDGRTLTCVACDAARTEEDLVAATAGRGADVSFVLDRLTGPRPAWRHAGLIDRKRIGMAGHSLGGASAAATMAGDRRVRAGVNVDGAFHDGVPVDGLDGRPFMMFGTDDETHRPGGRDRSWDEAWDRLDGWRRWLTVSGADHFFFTDIPVLQEELGASGAQPPLPGRRAMELTRRYVAAFFDLHLRDLPQPLLEGPTPAEPEVRFNAP